MQMLKSAMLQVLTLVETFDAPRTIRTWMVPVVCPTDRAIDGTVEGLNEAHGPWQGLGRR
jgi:hypothetical protein